MTKELVIVESPAKARTVGGFLGVHYIVKASIGHVRDLPKSRLGVDVENSFSPKYVVPREKKTVVRELKEAARRASAVYLATDPDREGEAISWHLLEAAELKGMPVHRVVFHEITKEAVDEAFGHPREIDMRLVNAQQARRILDRLVGYKISPLLWQKVRRGLSAGRVQSVALRMIVDREREIQAFVPVEYWSIEATLSKTSAHRKGEPASFAAILVGVIGSDQKLEIPDKTEADRLIADLDGASYTVYDVRQKKISRQPAPPFTTSTLQQEASRKLRFTAQRTMAIAQQLYEGLPIGQEGPVGLITYMRTDSTNVAASAVAEARTYIAEKYGSDFLPSTPRLFTRRAKGAQEAHEAIRPTSVRREPAMLKPYLTPEQFRLYELIWKRMVASQMSAATFDTTTVDIEAKSPKSATSYVFRASGSVISFPGFIVLYSEGKDESDSDEEGKRLPTLSVGELLKLLKLSAEQHFTQPPPRYTEAMLVKALEENGIGRPSTYAPILSTIQERDYVRRLEKRFHPTELGFLVNDLLAEHFSDVVDIGFTAQMEDKLDKIARGEQQWVPVLREFYDPFAKTVEKAAMLIPKVKVAEESAGENCEKCGQPMVIRMGRYGRFVACSNFPKCKNTKPLLIKIGVDCPSCGGALVERRAKRKRRFYGCANFPNCDFVINTRPIAQPCPHCGGLVTLQGKTAKCTQCGEMLSTPEKAALVETSV